MSEDRSVVEHWSRRLRDFIPDYFAQSPALQHLCSRCAVILHGSTTLGIDDAFSDLDLWLMADKESIQRAESTGGTRFFSFELHGKQGHFNLETTEEMAQRVRSCDLERIAELRRCHILADADGAAGELIVKAKQPMTESVRRAWFGYHYIQMRQFHRSCDNPLERGDALAFLYGLVPTLNHALRAAMVLDREPYPYIKWLGCAAGQMPTGRRISPLVQDILDLLAKDALRHPGPERGHPLGEKLREIRVILIENARVSGIDEPWLERWWVHMTQAAAGVASIAW